MTRILYARLFALFFLSASVSCLLSAPCSANNLTISSLVLTAPNSTNKTMQVQFDIAWANSWRNQTNYDAAWVFVKYSTDSGVTWNHATLKTAGTNPSGVNTGSGTDIDIIVPTDKKGAFIQRSSSGSGSLSVTSAQLVWDYNADGLTASSTARVKVFGIEMCYIPTGSFDAGDGTVSSIWGHFEDMQNDGYPRRIISEATLWLGWMGHLNNHNRYAMATPDDFDQDHPQTLPAVFPKGYGAFYLMKYELSQGQYTEFLNTLTRLQQNNRVGSNITADAPASSYIYVMSASAAITNRNTITCPASGNGTTNPITFSTTRSDRACNYVSWMDLCAYADWAALRPMTELEFEKACRGPNTAVANEHAWGNTTITAAATISGTENGTETITTANANAACSNTSFTGGDTGYGPLRCGIFATSTSTRTTAGAGYYGNMELSGGLWEKTVSIGNPTGRTYTGAHGDGILTTTASYQGNATNTGWPGIDGTTARGVTGATGAGERGGDFSNAPTYSRVSQRYQAAYTDTSRGAASGIRCARTPS